MTIIDAGAFLSLADAVATAVAGDVVSFSTDQEIDANLTIPAGVALLRERGARLQASSTSVELTINGDFSADRLRLFEGFGLGKVKVSNRTMAIPEWWGVRDGSGQDDIAINNAILAARHIGLLGDYYCAGTVLSPYGGYQGFRKRIVALAGRTSLFANTAGMTLFHHADSFATIKGIDLHANNQGVKLFKLMPELEEFNTEVANQNHNEIDVGLYGGDQGLIMMAGKAIDGQASGCWYNHIKFYSTSNGTSIWLKDNGSTDILSSGSNSNTFEGNQNGSIGLGVRIDAGGGNLFRIQQENMGKGIFVADQMVNGGDNPNNVFHDYHAENVTIHGEINEPTTKFYNSDLDHTRIIGAAREVFLDDGKSRYKTVSLTCDSCGSISLDPAYCKLSFQEKDGLMRVSGYLHVASITGSPVGVLHVGGLAKSCLTGAHSRTVGSVAANETSAGSGAAACLCRIIEGTNTLDIFVTNDGALKYLAPYLRAGSNLTISIEYPVR